MQKFRTMKTHETKTQVTICQNCILPETFPGIRFDASGICNYCKRESTTLAKTPEKKTEYRRNLDELIQRTRGHSATYDAIMAYSGGKDSSYTLKLLREVYDLHILAFTFDNHFISPEAWQNIKKVTDALQVDHVSFRLPWPLIKNVFRLTAHNDIFSKPTLLRASAVCTACIGLIKSLTLKTALEMRIPLVAFGWSPGQAPIQSAILKTNPHLIRQNQMVFLKAFESQKQLNLAPYLIPESYYDTYQDRFPCNIHPLAFFPYEEANIMDALQQLAWKQPDDTDSNSSNCLLNAFANHCHMERHGFHPYVWEIANMVRQGVMSRDQGLDKIYTSQDHKMVEYAQMKLGL